MEDRSDPIADLIAVITDAGRGGCALHPECREKSRERQEQAVRQQLPPLIAAERSAALREASTNLFQAAAKRFEDTGPNDPRGAAMWDCASWLADREEHEAAVMESPS